MGLNDDVDEGLGSVEGQNFDPNQPLPDLVTIVADDSSTETNKEVTESDLFGTMALKNEVPNLNAQFVLTVEQCNKAMDLIDVRNTIKASHGICKEDAELIDSNVPGFLNDKKPLGFFTNDKSQTQFSESLNSLDKAIDSNLGMITEQAKVSATNTCSKFLPLLKNLPLVVTDVTSKLQNEIVKLLDVVSGEGIHPGFTFADESNIRDVFYRSLSMSRDLEDVVHCDQDVQTSLRGLAQFLMNTSSYNNLKCVFYPLLDIGSEKTIFSIGSSNSFYEIVEEVPFLKCLDDEILKKFHITLTLYEIMTCSVDAITLESIKRLLGACSNIVTGTGATVEEIASISAEESSDQNSKLNRIVAINGANTKNTLFVLSVIVFIEEYIGFLTRLKNLLIVLSSKLK